MLRTKMKQIAFLAPLFFVIAMSLNSCYWSDPLKRDRDEISEDSVNLKSTYLYGFNLDSSIWKPLSVKVLRFVSKNFL